MCPPLFIPETIFGWIGTIQLFKNNLNFQKTCHKNVYKTCLKLDFRPILDAYNLLGYGETLSDKSGNSQQKQSTHHTIYNISGIVKNNSCFVQNVNCSSMFQKNKRKICYMSVPVAPPESISKHCLWWFEVLTLTAKKLIVFNSFEL